MDGRSIWRAVMNPSVQSELHALLWTCIPISTILLCRSFRWLVRLMVFSRHFFVYAGYSHAQVPQSATRHGRRHFDRSIAAEKAAFILLNVKNLLCNGLYGTASDDNQNNFFS
jgi:hypothetical protein